MPFVHKAPTWISHAEGTVAALAKGDFAIHGRLREVALSVRLHRWLRYTFWVLLAALAGVPAAASALGTQQVEITEYQGERLGSVADFRENSILGVQVVDPESYRLVVDGLVAAPAAFTYQELQSMSHIAKLVTIHCVEGWSVKVLWEGIPLVELFAQIGPQSAANTVIFHAVDGYTTSLPLEDVTGRNLIIADRINGVVLPAKNGFPLQLVAEDKWGYKWIRWIVRIELSSDASYRGYWESRGFSDSAESDSSMFGPR
jgi:DMSO/TMAO reductase YedYZ molybdopterin-dependent catalytic subunit